MESDFVSEFSFFLLDKLVFFLGFQLGFQNQTKINSGFAASVKHCFVTLLPPLP